MTAQRKPEQRNRIALNYSQEQRHKIQLYHNHHHDAPSARISLTFSRHPSLSSIASGRSSRLHHALAQSCCM